MGCLRSFSAARASDGQISTEHQLLVDASVDTPGRVLDKAAGPDFTRMRIAVWRLFLSILVTCRCNERHSDSLRVLSVHPDRVWVWQDSDPNHPVDFLSLSARWRERLHSTAFDCISGH
ncbi:hypothetical protein RRF57_011876 [Xylaria bambusicola]|uniref:Uncharacterized protein n=1 Tax=Xylaria bambusicola TaxID=326684 RepID=A0AAN7V392_9PEZI